MRFLPTNRPKLSKRVYLAIVAKKDMPLEVMRWSLAERFGWTLSQVDALTIEELHEFIQIEDGRAHARKSIVR